MSALEKISSGARKAGWLRGVSLIAWGVVAGFPAHAAAQTISASQGPVNSTGMDIYIDPNVVITGAPGIANSNVDTGTISSQGTIVSTGSDGVSNNASGRNTDTIGSLIIGTLGSISAQDGVANSGTDTQGYIGTLINDGNITALQYGYWNNYGDLGQLVNNGTIFGGTSGLYNYGNIETLTNTGVIHASSGAGIYNSGSSSSVGQNLIATLTNSGVISSDGGYGIQNSATDTTIGILANLPAGTISGFSSAIQNAGTIGTLTNSGLIESSNVGTDGIDNEGAASTIGVLDNLGGTILGYASGIYTAGAIGTLTNSGLIAETTGDAIRIFFTGAIGTLANALGGTISGQFSGIQNLGEINILTNAGLISASIVQGPTGGLGFSNAGNIDILTNDTGGRITGVASGINNTGAIGTLTNGGTIFGAINFGIKNTGPIAILDNIAGGTIAGQGSGIDNGGTISALTNSGLISGAVHQGIDNFQSITTLINAAGGTIAGHSSAVANFGEITVLTNAGLIAGAGGGLEGDGIYNDGTIQSVTNFANATISGTQGFVNSDIGVLGTLTNSGTITATSATTSGAVANYGSIGVLTNGGVISAPNAQGVNNVNFIGTLTNLSTGTIAGFSAGLQNQNTTGSTITSAIGTLTNSGVISGATAPGIENEAFLGTLSNLSGGFITGNPTGIDNSNDGTINILTNSGTVTGALESAIDNEGVLGTLANLAGGILQGASNGVFNNFGTIGTLTNSGLITSPTYGIYSDGTIGTILNAGTISGLTGIDLTTAGTTITNSGTIAGLNGGDAVLFGGVNTLILTTGSALSGAIDGGGTASQIVLQGTGELDNTITGFDSGSALAVTAGADWTGTGSWTVARVTNDGTFQGGSFSTPLNLTGDFLQNADGTLRVLVTPTTSTAFNVSGTATLAGTVSYLLAPGSYTPHVYPYLTAATVVGGFTTIDYGVIPVGDASTQQRGDPTVNLVITAPFTVGAAVVPVTPASPGAPAITPVALVIGPDDSAIFSAQAQALAQTANADTESLLGKAENGGAAASPACAAEAPLSPARTAANGASSTAQMASTLAGAFCGAGGWVEATGSLNNASASGGAPAYHADTGGFLAGIDRLIGAAGTRIGVAFGYDTTHLADKQGGSGGMGTTRVALYASQPLGQFTLAAVIAYGNASDSTSRATGIGNLSEKNNVTMFSGGAQLSTHLTLQNIDFEPAAGLRLASIGGGAHFAESATGIAAAFAVHGKTAQYNSVQPYALVQASRSFVTDTNMIVTPEAEIGYEYEAGSRGVSTTLTGADGTVFYSPHNGLDAGDALISAGIAAGRNNWSLYADYTARLSGNWNSQIAEGGLQVRF